MSKKITIGALVIITVLFALLVSQTSVLANETKTIEPKEKPYSLQLRSKATAVQNWVQERPDAFNKWLDETKKYQAENWQKGKEQNAKNLAKIKYFFLGDNSKN